MRVAFLTVLILISNAAGLCAQDPMALKEQANAQVIAASELMQEGMGVVQRGDASKEKIQVAISLLVQAGQRFEQAAKTYQTLIPDYATQTDVDNSMKAVQTCIMTIQRLKQSL